MKFIKASDRMPEADEFVVRYLDTGKTFVFNKENNFQVKIDFDGYHYKKELVVWLDETKSPDKGNGAANSPKDEGSVVWCRKCNGSGLVNEPKKPEKHDCAYCEGSGLNVELIENVLKQNGIGFDDKGLLYDTPPVRFGEMMVAIKQIISASLPASTGEEAVEKETMQTSIDRAAKVMDEKDKKIDQLIATMDQMRKDYDALWDQAQTWKEESGN